MAEESSQSRSGDEPGRGASGSDEEAEQTDETEETAGGGESSESGGGPSEAFSGSRREKAGVTAPSIGPDTIIDRAPPEERLAQHDQSTVDAMGKEKRRQIVGQTYGPTFARQATLYGGFLLLVVVIAIGAKLLIDHADQPPASNPAVAPWAQEDAPQHPPKPLQ